VSETKEKCIALVGRPNVGKSRLFNRLLGRRVSIVHDRPGVTRDIVAEKLGEGLMLMDTGGMFAGEAVTEKVISDATNEQAQFAILAADLILFVADTQEGVTALDSKIADLLRVSGKDIILVANKVDVSSHDKKVNEFYELGFKNVIGVSAEHGGNIEALINLIEERFGAIKPPSLEREEGRINICVAGRPNVGKSSICNAILGFDRLIVSNVAGTTRDTVRHDFDFEREDEDTIKFRLYDTAGLRARRKVNTSLDFLSGVRTRKAIEHCDIVFLIMDAMEGVSELDKRLAGEIMDAGASIILVVNKWDYAEKGFAKGALGTYDSVASFKKEFEEAVRKSLYTLGDSPIYFTSAIEKKGIDRLLLGASKLYKKMLAPVQTSKVNAAVAELMDLNQPKYVSGSRLKIYYAVKIAHRPLTFRFYCNKASIVTDAYKRYLEKGLREKFKLGGMALKLEFVGKTPQTLQERLGKSKPKRIQESQDNGRGADDNAGQNSKTRIFKLKAKPAQKSQARVGKSRVKPSRAEYNHFAKYSKKKGRTK